MSCNAEPLDFGRVPKHPLEEFTLEFDWLPNLSKQWEAGRLYSVGDIRRPTKPSGWMHRCEVAGQSDFREPRWKPEGLPTRDGSVEWSTLRATLDGVDIITDAVTTPDDGISLGTPTWDGADVRVKTQGGEDGTDYAVRCEITTQSGEHLVGIAIVQVRSSVKRDC